MGNSYEANKRLVEDAWGHGVTTEFVPIRYNWGNIGPILDGMRAAVANGTAAGIDMSAYDLARMDWGGGPPNTEHMSGSDAAIIADALAKSLAPTVQALANGGSPDPSPQPEPEPVPTAPASGEESPDPEQRDAGTGPDRLVLKISQDAYQGSAEYTVSVDGEQIGGTFTASASNSAGESDTLTLKGDWDAGRHEVAVTFLNDKWDGTPDTDRNLYVDGITYTGAALRNDEADLLEAGTARFAFAEDDEAAAPSTGPEPTEPEPSPPDDPAE
ncbi:MAG TPA: carbohydrate-binding domain-containing protein, partial [Solirubrobacteraceae bacterium]|nr:carbohydrate-binding domain-containing protein [Solirubrobacteraceae bacterium]